MADDNLTASQQTDNPQPPASYNASADLPGFSSNPSTTIQGELTDDDLAALLCDSEGNVMGPDQLQANMVSVQKCIDRTIKAISTWIAKMAATVNDVISSVVQAALSTVAQPGIDVANLITQIENEIIQWIANGIGSVGEMLGGLPSPKKSVSQEHGSTASADVPVEQQTGISPQENSSQSIVIPSFPTGTAGAGFGGSTAVGGSPSRGFSNQTTATTNETTNETFPQTTAGNGLPMPTVQADDCSSLSDEERAIWGCETREDAIKLRFFGDFAPQLPPGVKLKQWLEDSFPVLKDSRNTPDVVY